MTHRSTEDGADAPLVELFERTSREPAPEVLARMGQRAARIPEAMRRPRFARGRWLGWAATAAACAGLVAFLWPGGASGPDEPARPFAADEDPLAALAPGPEDLEADLEVLFPPSADDDAQVWMAATAAMLAPDDTGARQEPVRGKGEEDRP